MGNFIKFKNSTAAAILLAVSACASPGPIGTSPRVEVTDLTALPAPRGSSILRLGPQETVKITVADAEGLTGTYLTDVDGKLELPLIGTVDALGNTPSDVARKIEDRLRGQFILDPRVQVIPEREIAATISIGGEVSRSGTLPAASSYTLLRALNNAGGFSRYAKRDEILVMRVVEGQEYIGVYSYKEISRGNAPDPAIFPGDIVMVGDSPARRQFEDILNYVGAISATLILVNRVDRSF